MPPYTLIIACLGIACTFKSAAVDVPSEAACRNAAEWVRSTPSSGYFFAICAKKLPDDVPRTGFACGISVAADDNHSIGTVVTVPCSTSAAGGQPRKD